jgi:hypothetical protein
MWDDTAVGEVGIPQITQMNTDSIAFALRLPADDADTIAGSRWCPPTGRFVDYRGGDLLT